MNILVIGQYYLGRDDAGGSRWNQFARYWTAANHEVTILSGMVHYASGKKDPKYKGRCIVREREECGATVYRCHVSESYRQGAIGRAWGILTFTFWSVIAGLTRVHHPDVIVATSPPLGVVVTMWVLSVWYRVPSVFEVRDLWPDCFRYTGLTRNPLVLWPLYLLEAIGYRHCCAINALTPAFRKWIHERKGIPLSKIAMIPNAADTDLMGPGRKDNEVRRQHNLEGKFVVGYFGAHGWPNMLGQLLDVATMIKDEMPDVRIMLVGDGVEKPALVERARKENLTNVVFVNPVPKRMVGDYINACDACAATLRDNEHYKLYYPNKVFDYMCCGRPTIIAIDGVARELVEGSGAGLFVEPGKPESFCQAIRTLRANPDLVGRMEQAGPIFVREKFSRETLAGKYLELLGRVANGGTACPVGVGGGA